MSVQGLVGRLVTFEASKNQEGLVAASERVADKLRLHLSRVIGTEGFRTLLDRAVRLATTQFPSFASVHVEDDGSLVGLRELSQEVSEAAPALLENVFELLNLFIGEHLVLQMVSAMWPELEQDATGGTEETEPS